MILFYSYALYYQIMEIMRGIVPTPVIGEDLPIAQQKLARL